MRSIRSEITDRRIYIAPGRTLPLEVFREVSLLLVVEENLPCNEFTISVDTVSESFFDLPTIPSPAMSLKEFPTASDFINYIESQHSYSHPLDSVSYSTVLGCVYDSILLYGDAARGVWVLFEGEDVSYVNIFIRLPYYPTVPQCCHHHLKL